MVLCAGVATRWQCSPILESPSACTILALLHNYPQPSLGQALAWMLETGMSPSLPLSAQELPKLTRAANPEKLCRVCPLLSGSPNS